MTGTNGFIRRTSTILFLVFAFLSITLLLVSDYALSVYWNKSLLQYKKEYLKDQSHKMAYALRSKVLAAPFTDEQKEWLRSTAWQYSAVVRYYAPDRVALWYDSAGGEPSFRDPYAIELPVIEDGTLTGYLSANYDLSSDGNIPYFSEMKRNAKNGRIVTVGAMLVISLLISVYAAKRLAKPLQTSGKLATHIVNGNRETTIPVSGTNELVQLTHAINYLLEEFNRQENWRKQLMQDLTHELRTPLTSVLSRLEALIDGIYPTTEENLNRIYAEIDRLYRLVADMEKLSEAEGARFQLNIRRVNMAHIMRSVYEGFLFMAKEKDIHFTYLPPHFPCNVEVDPDRIIQVLSNMISNAIKYTPAGGKVEVGLNAEPDDMNELSLYCTDNGIGISEQDIPLIFNRFYRVEKSRSRQSGGLGVGLSIAKALVEAHGGTIAVDSKEGSGSTFRVKLPVVNKAS
ncbi:sensor histidine kinase [Paenibacillus sp. MBLB4367]|uniref:sensor histidine kinase n=1 Tax=Paenibacillus sp. MBLB4367 TaxID=3384767 RepID=UPI00390831D1